jgi:microcystin degradation protein MlrC
MSPRVGLVGLWHETNTYSASPATLADFANFELLAGSSLAEHNRGARTVIGGYLDASAFDVVPVFAAGAWPSGPATGEVLDELLTRTEDELRRAGPLDAILVNLHGAMVAQTVPDVEAALLGTVRRAVGQLPVGAVLDLHANPSPALTREADILVSYDTFPHVDMYERGAEVAGLLGQVLGGRSLRTSMRKVPLLVCPIAQSTDDGPLGEVQRRAARRGRQAGLARVCVTGGFAYSDVDRAGMSVLAVHDDATAAAARHVLDETVADIAAHAGEFMVSRPGPAEAVRLAMTLTRRPVFLADVADNIGGGSPGDGTALLAELLKAGARDCVISITDHEVAMAATKSGAGTEVDTLLGGKTDRMHGDPVRVRGRVVRTSDGRYRSGGYYMTGQEFSMGPTAVLDVAGNTIVVTARPTPPFHAEQLSSVGVDVRTARIVVVKGALAWREAFRDVAGDVVEVATPGICPVDVSALPRHTVPMAC